METAIEQSKFKVEPVLEIPTFLTPKISNLLEGITQNNSQIIICEPPPAYAIFYPEAYANSNHNLGLAITGEVAEIVNGGIATMFDDLTSGREESLKLQTTELGVNTELELLKGKFHSQYLNENNYGRHTQSGFDAKKRIPTTQEISFQTKLMELKSRSSVHTLESGFVNNARGISNLLLQQNLLETTHSGNGFNLKDQPDINIVNSKGEPSCPLLDACFNIFKIETMGNYQEDIYLQPSTFITVHPESFVDEQRKMLIILKVLNENGLISLPEEFVYFLLTYNLCINKKTKAESIQYTLRKSTLNKNESSILNQI